MLRKIGLIVSLVALSLMAALPAYAAGPNFQAGLWADDEQWGTKVTTPLPAPKKNGHSFDAFYFITAPGWTSDDGPGGWLQPPVMEAAPGNPAFDTGLSTSFPCGLRGFLPRTSLIKGKHINVCKPKHAPDSLIKKNPLPGG